MPPVKSVSTSLPGSPFPPPRHRGQWRKWRRGGKQHRHRWGSQGWRVSPDRAAGSTVGSGTWGRVHLLQQHRRGWEGMGLSRQPPGPLKKRKPWSFPLVKSNPSSKAQKAAGGKSAPVLTQKHRASIRDTRHQSETAFRMVRSEDNHRRCRFCRNISSGFLHLFYSYTPQHTQVCQNA